MDRGNDSLVIWYGIKQLGLFLGCGGEAEDGGHVAGPVAVVWSRPHRHQLAVEHVLDACRGLRLLGYVHQSIHTYDAPNTKVSKYSSLHIKKKEEKKYGAQWSSEFKIWPIDIMSQV